MIHRILLVALAYIASPSAIEDPPSCPTNCTPEFEVLTTAGSGWTATPGSTVSNGKGTEFCENCIPCKGGVDFSFTPSMSNQYWKSHTDNGDFSGFGATAGWIRVESGCDETNVNVFKGWDGVGGGASLGVSVNLYCTCGGA